MVEDRQLLVHYVSEGSEQAFTEIVRRHMPLVYSAALRRTGGDSELAKDAAQLVFAALARKARSLPKGVVLAGWLHQATRFAAAQLLRVELRRRAREQEVFAMTELQFPSIYLWQQIRPLIDQALDQLPHKDRDALLLRFFEQQDYTAVGMALGTTAEAARKRVDRALEHLRKCLYKRKIATSAAALGATLSVNALELIPAGFASSLASSSAAALAAGSAPSGGLLSLILTAKAQLAVVTVAVTGVATTSLLLQGPPAKARAQQPARSGDTPATSTETRVAQLAPQPNLLPDDVVPLSFKVIGLDGSTRYLNTNMARGSWTALRVGDEVWADVLQTESKGSSTADLELVGPDSRGWGKVRMFSNCVLKPLRLDLKKSGPSQATDIRFDVAMGQIRVSLDGGSDYVFALNAARITPVRAVAAPKETVFLFASPDSLTVLKGLVTASFGSGTQKLVRAGEQLRGDANEVAILPPDAPEIKAGRMSTIGTNASSAADKPEAGEMLHIEELRDVGTATPAALFQTFLWAVPRGDTNRIAQLLAIEAGTDMAQRFLEELRERASVGRAAVESSSPVTAWRILEDTPAENDDRWVSTVLYFRDDHTARIRTRVRRAPDGWKLVVGDKYPLVQQRMDETTGQWREIWPMEAN